MRPPLLNPSLDDLNDRLNALQRSGRQPLGMAMSPETWRRLLEESGYTGVKLEAALASEEPRVLFGVPVQLHDGAEGVGITFDVARN